jgi:hypothetical protein
MLNEQVTSWLQSLEQKDQKNVASFVETCCEFFGRHKTFLAGSGFYAVGSSLAKRTYVYKGDEDYFDAQMNIEKKNSEKLIKEFGEEKLKQYILAERGKPAAISSGDYRIIKKAVNENLEQSRKDESDLFKREHYGDIDLVLAGLRLARSNVRKRIWRRFSQKLKMNFPSAKHPKPNRDLEDIELKENGFGFWDIYSDQIEYVVRDYRIEIPTGKEPTEIHFMMYKSDERFGSVSVGDNWHNHWPNKDVSREMWKQQQKYDRLPFLPIIEF